MASTANLIDMPDIAMNKILEYCNFIDIQNLVKTCHTLRNYIPEAKPLYISGINIWAEPNYIRFIIVNKEILYKTEYKNRQGKCSICRCSENGDQTKLTVKENFVLVFMRDIGCLLKQFKNTVDNLTLIFNTHFWELTDKAHQFETDFVNELEEVLVPLQVIDVNLRLTDSRKFINILHHIDSKTLMSLSLTNHFHRLVTLDLTEIMRSEHWKNLMQFSTISFLISEPLISFGHILDVSLDLEVVTKQNIDEIKQYLLSLSPGRSISLGKATIEEVLQVFGSASEIQKLDDRGDHFTQYFWFFQNQEDPEKVMMIIYCSENYLFNFSSLLVDASEVPNRCVIQKL